MITLAQLTADPARLEDVEPGDVPALVVTLAALMASVAAKALVPVEKPADDAHDLVDAAAAAQLLGMTKTFVQRHSRRLPFYRKIGGAARYSKKGIARWLESRRK